MRHERDISILVTLGPTRFGWHVECGRHPSTRHLAGCPTIRNDDAVEVSTISERSATNPSLESSARGLPSPIALSSIKTSVPRMFNPTLPGLHVTSLPAVV